MVQMHSNVEICGCAAANARLVVGTTPTLLGFTPLGSMTLVLLPYQATMTNGSSLARQVLHLARGLRVMEQQAKEEQV